MPSGVAASMAPPRAVLSCRAVSPPRVAGVGDRTLFVFPVGL